MLQITFEELAIPAFRQHEVHIDSALGIWPLRHFAQGAMRFGTWRKSFPRGASEVVEARSPPIAEFYRSFLLLFPSPKIVA